MSYPALTTLLCIAVLFFPESLHAQYEPVVFDTEKQYFNNGQKLRAEHYLLFSGAIPNDFGRVEVSVYRSGGKRPVFNGAWKRSFNNTNGMFELPLNYRLRGATEYDFHFSYYRQLNNDERQQLREGLFTAIDAYIEQTYLTTGRKVQMLQTPSRTLRSLNQLTRRILMPYRNYQEETFDGFSPVVLQSMRNFKGRNLKGAASLGDTTGSLSRRERESSGAAQLYANRIDDLKKITHQEVDALFNNPLLIKSDTRQVKNYPTESTMNILSVNIGYGAVYFSGSISELYYDTAPYVGLSFPLGNRAFSGRIWSNTSLSAGAFLTNFRDEDGVEVTGPIFGRPYFLGLGYRVFQFVRINAGAVALERGNNAGAFLSNVEIRPFAGMSAEINLWMGLGNKRR
jgi:hypothetical protein